MQINYFSNQNTKTTPAFGGHRLCRVNLKKIGQDVSEVVPAYFTRLTPEDKKSIQGIIDLWEQTALGDLILLNFLKSISSKIKPPFSRGMFFVVETPNALRHKDRVKSLAEVSIKDDELYVDALQSASKFYRSDNNLTKVSGGGTAMIYGLTKIAEKLKLKGISLQSRSYESDDWYRKLGFGNTSWSDFDFFMPASAFKSFRNKVKSKYNM